MGPRRKSEKVLTSSRTISRRVHRRMAEFNTPRAGHNHVATLEEPIDDVVPAHADHQHNPPDDGGLDDVVHPDTAMPPPVRQFENTLDGSSFDDDSDVDGIDRVPLSADERSPSEDELSENQTDSFVCSDDIFQTIATPSLSLTLKLATIAIFFNLPNTVLNAILALLRFLGHDVPKDARTIKRTPRSGPGSDSFAHFGLKKGILRQLKHRLHVGGVIRLNFNIDGIPLFKNSKTCFWPILGMITNGPSFKSPFVVSCFCGDGKPPYLNDYLDPFLSELLTLLRDGVAIGNKHYDVRVNAIICDAPARSFIRATIGHNGTKGCERCTQAAKKENNRMVYHHTEGFTSRTNETFRRQRDRRHHVGRSPFLVFNDEQLDMVSQFPIEYMHCVCLGVVKKLLNLWVEGGIDQAAFDVKMKQLIKSFPKEINRKGRSIHDLCRWKATEFRSFLLYSGPLILKGLLDGEKYDNFINLSSCIRILLSPRSTAEQIMVVKNCLKYFVSEFKRLYGVHHVVFNVHNLIHLADDCLYFNSPLDDFSSFPFENYLGKLKRLLRSTRRPLSQLHMRLVEMEHQETSVYVNRPNPYCDHSLRSIINSLTPSSFSDAYCLIDNVPIEVTGIADLTVKGHPLIVGRNADGSFLNFSDSLVSSSDLCIYIVNGRENRIVTFHCHVDISLKKCMLMPFYDNFNEKKFLIAPLLHHQ